MSLVRKALHSLLSRNLDSIIAVLVYWKLTVVLSMHILRRDCLSIRISITTVIESLDCSFLAVMCTCAMQSTQTLLERYQICLGSRSCAAANYQPTDSRACQDRILLAPLPRTSARRCLDDPNSHPHLFPRVSFHKSHVSVSYAMHALILLLSFTTHYALALASRSPPSDPDAAEISFFPQDEYTLAHNIDLIGSPQQDLFDISSLQHGPSFSLKTRPVTVYRPRSQEALQRSRVRAMRGEPIDDEVEWEEVRMAGPYIEDKHTLSQLARMTGNAYALPGQKNWYDIDVTWNTVRPGPLLR